MKWWNNGIKNVRSEVQPEGFISGRIGFVRKSLPKLAYDKISKKLKGRTPKNKGAKGVSLEVSMKMSISAKNRALRDNTYSRLVDYYESGGMHWNSGLTAESDGRIKTYSDKQRGQKRQGNYKPQYHWRGQGNPKFGKDMSGNNSPRYVEERHKREWFDYRNKVSSLTEQTYKQHSVTINPNGYKRTLAGIQGGYHLDHIFPIWEAYKQNISPEDISKKENLQMLPWLENIIKSNKTEQN